MAGVSDKVINRALGHFEKISSDYANGVRKALKKIGYKVKQDKVLGFILCKKFSLKLQKIIKTIPSKV
ncbi:hypothetical protein [Campylobacter pinnipediorum]|uniref:hypothetical protein n=1 Tax=Campylobacter pinnipediorum TaxID=1965231 RepID=UPI001F1C43EF|nr:hypothetical protein [Campylobacter pinnipediorum]